MNRCEACFAAGERYGVVFEYSCSNGHSWRPTAQQPNGFTHEDVATLRRMCSAVAPSGFGGNFWCEIEGGPFGFCFACRLADKIAALLPPV